MSDNHYAPNDLESTLSIASAIEDVGLRGVVARGIVGPPTEVARRMDLASGLFTRSAEEEELEITRACLEARGNGGRVVVWPAPLNVTYVGQDLLRDTVRLRHRVRGQVARPLLGGRHQPSVLSSTPTTLSFSGSPRTLGDDATLAHSFLVRRRRDRVDRGDEDRHLVQPGLEPVPSFFLTT